MTKAVARALCRLAVICLPKAQRAWGLAMRSELDQITTPGAALAFALGCVRVGVAQRVRDPRTCYLSGRAIVMAVSLACAAFHLGCASVGAEVLRGARLDPVVPELMIGPAGPGAVAVYLTLRPLMVLLIALLAVFHTVMAWEIWRGQLRPFAAAWALATITAFTLDGSIILAARSTEGTLLQVAGLIAQAVVFLGLISPNAHNGSDTYSGRTV